MREQEENDECKCGHLKKDHDKWGDEACLGDVFCLCNKFEWVKNGE